MLGLRNFALPIANARVAELVDALDSKSSDRKVVWVRFPPRVHQKKLSHNRDSFFVLLLVGLGLSVFSPDNQGCGYEHLFFKTTIVGNYQYLVA